MGGNVRATCVRAGVDVLEHTLPLGPARCTFCGGAPMIRLGQCLLCDVDSVCVCVWGGVGGSLPG
jgi:hypothetical protein